jgi:hypothetical protein
VDLSIYRASRLMMLADYALATGAASDLVGGDDLSRATFAVPDALRAEPSRPARRTGIRNGCVRIANQSAAMCAGDEAGSAGRMIAVGAPAFVFRAVCTAA